MTKNLFRQALTRTNTDRPPVWFMRQAGRYHKHYQALRAQYSFIELCKIPEVACKATLGPIEDFGFDAAILFSDLLFPLEAMGMGLSYNEGPKLDWHLRSTADVARLKGGAELVSELKFQEEAMRLIRATLPTNKGLLGFVGGPLTLFFYAVEGSHKGELESARLGLTDGRFEKFCDKLLDLLAHNMHLQARGGADVVAVLDTCGGEVSPEIYKSVVVPSIHSLIERFHKLSPGVPVAYYSKGTNPNYWRSLEQVPISCLGIDWHHNIAQVLHEWGQRWAIQGNVDPQWLFLPEAELEHRLRQVFEQVLALPAASRQGWICGLGHGVLPKTPESNVKLFIRLQHELFGGKP